MKKMIQAQITLLSSTGKITAPLRIHYDDSEDTVNTVEVNLTYNGVVYQGNGTDFLWVDAFATLQSRLPKNIKIGGEIWQSALKLWKKPC